MSQGKWQVSSLPCTRLYTYNTKDISCYNLGENTESWKKSVNRLIFGIPTTLAALVVVVVILLVVVVMEVANNSGIVGGGYSH